MKRSTERILTTHTGSLPRPQDLVDVMTARENGLATDDAGLAERVRSAVAEIVQRQVAVGVDVIDDGEMSKPSYATYVKDRLTGFGGESIERRRQPEADDFPEFFAAHNQGVSRRGRPTPACDAPVAPRDTEAVQHDIANLKAAVAALGENGPTDVFMTAASPGVIARFLSNQYYPTFESYLAALADAMRPEYEAIAKAGFVLQLDCPDLTRYSGDTDDFTEAERLSRLRLHIEALNQAVSNIPPEQMRMHLCWGNYPGPHTRDVPLGDIIEAVFTARPSAISFEAANPRHAHEWAIFERIKLPDGKVLIPGVLDSTTNYVEHPELVAQRIGNYARLVGRENVIAGSDCGFSTIVGNPSVDPRVTFAKLAAMAEGARLASETLW